MALTVCYYVVLYKTSIECDKCIGHAVWKQHNQQWCMDAICTKEAVLVDSIPDTTVPVKKKLKYRTVTVPYLEYHERTKSEPRANRLVRYCKCGAVRCGAV